MTNRIPGVLGLDATTRVRVYDLMRRGRTFEEAMDTYLGPVAGAMQPTPESLAAWKPVLEGWLAAGLEKAPE